MADIILAQVGWNTWMVTGESFLNDLLTDDLHPDVTIEFITCQSESEVQEIWSASVDNPVTAGPPWLINPAIAERVRRVVGMGGDYGILFGPWSAAFDANAEYAIANAAASALANETASVVLMSYVASDAPPFAGDLANIRVGMVEKELIARGIGHERFVRERRVPDEGDTEKADHIIIHVTGK